MKLRQFIEKLQQFDPDSEVWHYYEGEFDKEFPGIIEAGIIGEGEFDSIHYNYDRFESYGGQIGEKIVVFYSPSY